MGDISRWSSDHLRSYKVAAVVPATLGIIVGYIGLPNVDVGCWYRFACADIEVLNFKIEVDAMGAALPRHFGGLAPRQCAMAHQ